MMSEKKSTAKTFGELLKNELKNNKDFYFFSPDETTSNRLDAVFDESNRAWSSLPIKPQDLPESDDGRIIELLSENTLFAVMTGHLLSGEPAMMTSYESFFPIITSQILQFLKFIEQSEVVPFRPEYPAVNLLSTSTCWRQDHNGFSHQSPVLISTLLDHPAGKVNCLFPADSESAKETYKFMMESKNVVNLTTFNKTEELQYLDESRAKGQFEHGASVFDFISDGEDFKEDEEQKDFDFVFVAAGDIATRESIAAIKILKQDFPELKIRFINILALSYNHIGTTKNQMEKELFDKMFGNKATIISNFHGYADTLKNILSNYTNRSRISAHGFEEHGTTTTPFDMLTLNHASRYDLAIDVANRIDRADYAERYQDAISKNYGYVREFGEDSFEL